VALEYIRSMLAEVAPLLLRDNTASSSVKPVALKVLLLMVTLSPPAAVVTVLSLLLPLLIGCMWLGRDGAPDAVQKELSTLAHASITALGKRHTAEFRQAVAAFSDETRTRMESALREAAAASQQAASAASTGAAQAEAKPKIALRMDFSSFGKR